MVRLSLVHSENRPLDKTLVFRIFHFNQRLVAACYDLLWCILKVSMHRFSASKKAYRHRPTEAMINNRASCGKLLPSRFLVDDWTSDQCLAFFILQVYKESYRCSVSLALRLKNHCRLITSLHVPLSLSIMI